MKKGRCLICQAILGAALLFPLSAQTNVAQAQEYNPYAPHYSIAYPGYTGWSPYTYAPLPYYTPGPSLYSGWGWGAPPLYFNSPSGYEALTNDPHYRYSNGYHYYVLDNGSYYVYDQGNWVYHEAQPTLIGFDRLREDSHYRYSNGYHYYVLDNGNYYVYNQGSWVYHEAQPTLTGFDRLREDPHYRYSNGYHYYVLDNGDYYYYSNGQWILVKSEAPTPDPDPRPDPDPEPTPTPLPTPDPTPNPGERPVLVPDENPGPTPSIDDLDKPVEWSEEPSEPLPVFRSITDELTGLEHPAYAPDPSIDYDRLAKPTLPPTDPAMQADPHFIDSDGTYYYVVALTDAEKDRGIDGYYKWDGFRWKLHNGTASDDPALDPANHTHTEDSDYVYDDEASTFKAYSENVIGKGLAGDPLPFKTVDEFKDYIIRHYAPVFKDNAGWEAKVTWELEDEDSFNKSKDAAWARDYVIVANLKSGVDQDDYRDRDLAHVKFIYRVLPDAHSDYIESESAKLAFDQINVERKAQGLKELEWSDDVYNAKALPQAKAISRQYDSDDFSDRRETDGKKVVEKWLHSGLRDFLLSPDVKEGAVACVIAGDGSYYWTFQYQ